MPLFIDTEESIRVPAVGDNNADNSFVSSLVVANRDGSVLERIEWMMNELGATIVAEGTFTADSLTVPADTTMGGMNVTGFWDGKLLMPITGAVAWQAKVITAYTGVTGVFTLDAEHPFTALPGLVDYVIIAADISLVPAADSVINTLPAHVIGNKTDISAIPSDTTSLVAMAKKIYETAVNIEASLLILTETGSTITTDGAEQDVYINNSPFGVFSPKFVQIDFTNQTATETIVLREYYRIKSGGNFIQMDEETFIGIVTMKLKNIELKDNRYGVKITMQKTAGAAKDYDYGVTYAI